LVPSKKVAARWTKAAALQSAFAASGPAVFFAVDQARTMISSAVFKTGGKYNGLRTWFIT
jgi:hypothetical protein